MGSIIGHRIDYNGYPAKIKFDVYSGPDKKPFFRTTLYIYSAVNATDLKTTNKQRQN